MRQPSEAEIANALSGKFYQLTRDGEVVDAKTQRSRPPNIRAKSLAAAKWTDAENARLIQLYRAGVTWETLTATLGRNHRLVRFRYRELVAKGVLVPRRTGRRRNREV